MNADRSTGPQQRLDAQEPHRRRALEQVRNPLVRRLLVLHARAEPDVGARAYQARLMRSTDGACQRRT